MPVFASTTVMVVLVNAGLATVCSLCTAVAGDLAKNHKKVSMSSSVLFTLFLQGHCYQLH